MACTGAAGSNRNVQSASAMQSYWCSISPHGNSFQHSARSGRVLAVRSCRLSRAGRSAGALHSQVEIWANAFAGRLFGIENAFPLGIPDDPMPSFAVPLDVDRQNGVVREFHVFFEKVLKIPRRHPRFLVLSKSNGFGLVPAPRPCESKGTMGQFNAVICKRPSQVFCMSTVGNISFRQHLAAYLAIALT